MFKANPKIVYCVIWASLFALSNLATAQNYPRDNSYTAEATLKKELKNFKQLTLASLDVPNNIQQWVEQPYKTLGKRQLTLNVYSPKKRAAPLPIVMLVHGGGWRSGNKTMLTPLAVGLAKKGFSVAVIDYRLSLEAKFPAAVYDVVDAITWLKQHGSRFGGNPNRIALGGTSAGGQLASLVAYSRGNLNLSSSTHNLNEIGVQVLLNLDGVMDFTSAEALPFENDPNREVTAASLWLGGKYETVPNIWRSASAFYYVNNSAPPTLFLNSARPRFHAGRDATITKLNALNVPNKTITLANTPHTFWLFEQWLPTTVEHCAQFLKAHL